MIFIFFCGLLLATCMWNALAFILVRISNSRRTLAQHISEKNIKFSLGQIKHNKTYREDKYHRKTERRKEATRKSRDIFNNNICNEKSLEE